MRFSLLLSLPLWMALSVSPLSALTLEESVIDVISTHPAVQAKLKHYNFVKEDLNVADAGFLPSIDLVSAVGHKETGVFNDNVPRDGYEVYQNSITLTQNLFDGFGTVNQISYEKTRTVAAAYDYIETANDFAYQMVTAYINVLRARELYDTAMENIRSNEAIFAKVYGLYTSGLAPRSEIDRIQATLALSRSNATVKRNNLYEARYRIHRLLGRDVDETTLQKPKFKTKLPTTRERAMLYAIDHNPSLMVSHFNIKGAQELYKQSKKNYYPTLDLEVSQHYNDNLDNFTGADDRFQAMLILRYNLYRGGSDSAVAQKNISKVNEEVEILREHKREVIEGLGVSWASSRLISMQLDDLFKSQSFSYTTLSLYQEEYELGKRTLLDLLAIQNDFFSSQNQIINAEYDLLLAKYRVLDAMGVMVQALAGNEFDYMANVGLVKPEESENEDGNATEEAVIVDSLPVKFDSDNDYIPDSQDLCSNSEANMSVSAFGCVKLSRDSDGDGVFDTQDECPFTALGLDVDAKGCPTAIDLNIIFNPLSNKVSKKSKLMIEQLARFLKENPLYNVVILGHTDDVGIAEDNIKLSQQRAESVKEALMAQGVEEVRLQASGEGESHPIADNATEEGRQKNRRISILLNYIDDAKGGE